MVSRKAAEYLFVGIFFLLIGTIVLGQILGQPVLLSYVTTGSMAPTLDPGDGFVAVPMAIAGPIEQGDVIVFEAETLHGGGLTTHRVVGKTDAGYITKGDANPTTDQSSGEPPVKQPQIVAKAFQIGDSVVVIPNFGLLVTGVGGLLSGVQRQVASIFNLRALLGTQGFAYILFAVGTLSYLASVVGNRGETREREGPSRSDTELTGPLLVIGFTVLVLILVTTTMVVPGGTQEFSIVSSSNDEPGIGVIQAGTTESFQYQVPSNGIIPVVVVFEESSEGLDIEPDRMYVPPNSVKTSIIELHAPDETGHYRRFVVEHRYLALLPRDVIYSLYEVHSWLPILVIDILIGVGFAGIGYGILGSQRGRNKSRDPSYRDQLRQWLR